MGSKHELTSNGTAAETSRPGFSFCRSLILTTKQCDEIRISAKNSNGFKFTVILSALKGKDGEQTRAHIEWDGGRDEQTGILILSKLDSYYKAMRRDSD